MRSLGLVVVQFLLLDDLGSGLLGTGADQVGAELHGGCGNMENYGAFSYTFLDPALESRHAICATTRFVVRKSVEPFHVAFFSSRVQRVKQQQRTLVVLVLPSRCLVHANLT